ncbi:substrate-binding domain-containing protein [Pantoea sp. B65]
MTNTGKTVTDIRPAKPLRIGLLVPFHGSDAIWGPSCQYSAVLAAAEINRSSELQIELFAADAGGDPQQVVARSWQLFKEHQVDVLVGVHLSSVRVALREAFAGIIPYVFAPLYEGGENTPGVYAIGETPHQQFPAAIYWMMKNLKAQRWFIVGNDYIWPRASHDAVRNIIQRNNGEIVGEDYLGLGQTNIGQVINNIKKSNPDIVFVSLVGTDCVLFNRAFAKSGLSGRVLRLSGSIEENILMGIGSGHNHNLYCAASYFNSLDTAENRHFMNQYRAAFGQHAPVQSVLSQSCYEAIHFFSALVKRAGGLSLSSLNSAYEGLRYQSVRGHQQVVQGCLTPTIYLAKARDLHFEIVQALPPLPG